MVHKIVLFVCVCFKHDNNTNDDMISNNDTNDSVLFCVVCQSAQNKKEAFNRWSYFVSFEQLQNT